MELKLDRKLTALVRRKVRSGQYASDEDVVASGLGSLIVDERFGDFAAGELDALIDEGEARIAADGTLDGEKAYLQRKRRQARAGGPALLNLTPSNGFSAQVRIEFRTATRTLPAAQTGGNRLIFDRPVMIPETEGDLVMRVDGHEHHWHVELLPAAKPQCIVFISSLTPIQSNAPASGVSAVSLQTNK